MNPVLKKAILNGSILSAAITVLVSVLKAGVCEGCFAYYLSFGGPVFSLLALLASCAVVIPIMYIALLVNKREETGDDTIYEPGSMSGVLGFFHNYKDTLLLFIVFAIVGYLIWWSFNTFFTDRTYGTQTNEIVDEYYEQFSD